jgi:formamidopyrimidine-DNA glycosylase
MPELPEVETIALALKRGYDGRPPLPGRRVDGMSLRWPRHIAEPSVPVFRRRLRGQTIHDVARRGKYFVMPLDQGTLLVHLKMSGDLRLTERETPRGPFEHTILHLDDGWDLRFSDSRKFGKLYLLHDPERVLGRLGPEPLSPGFTPDVLAERLAAHDRQLKPLLLDQTFIAGLGNIYADEALHRARLHPLRRSRGLNAEEVDALWRGIRAALRQGIRHNGASIDWVYRGGDFQNHFRVYQRAGKACPSCGSSIVRTVIGQRGSHFCPRCQPEPES